MKKVAFKKYRKNIFHTVIYLKIPFHLYQPTFGRDEFFFSFSSKIPYAYFLNGSTPKTKTASNVLLRSKNIANKVYDVQTMQTKFARFRQKSSGLISWTPPKISTNRRACLQQGSATFFILRTGLKLKIFRGEAFTNKNKCSAMYCIL